MRSCSCLSLKGLPLFDVSSFTLPYSILLELALKAYVYYHGHCLQSELIVPKPMPPVEAAPRKMHSVLKKDKVTNGIMYIYLFFLALLCIYTS